MTRLLRGLVIAVVCLIAVACTDSRVLPGPDRHSVSAVSRGCAHLHRHQYEVCYAYLVNDSLLARVPFYEAGREPALRRPALTRLKSRYYGLFAERNAPHAVLLERAPTMLCLLGHCLHKWVVVRIR